MAATEPFRAPAGLILAGGEGRRMGRADKALLPFRGAPLLTRVLDRFAPQVDDLALSANGDPARFIHFGLPVLADAPPSKGPLSGLLSGLTWAESLGHQALVTVPVDAPFLPQDLVPRLLLHFAGAPVLALADGLHPTFALWPVTARADLATFLASGAPPRLRDFAATLHAVHAPFPDPREFSNLNTPEDLARAERDV